MSLLSFLFHSCLHVCMLVSCLLKTFASSCFVFCLQVVDLLVGYTTSVRFH